MGKAARRKAVAAENTIFDSVYRTMIQNEMTFPGSCVLYLRHTKRTPDLLEMKVNLPDGQSFRYKVPVIKVQDYTREEMFQKKLKKGVDKIMGGQVLELESERIQRLARRAGIKGGIAHDPG